MTLEATVNVGLAPVSYDIFIGREMDDFIREWIHRMYPGRQVFLLVDGPFYELYENDLGSFLENINLEVFIVPSGERNKTLGTMEKVYNFLYEKGCDRGSLIISMGGGITGDIAGFAAASFMRGIDYIQIPTTLLAQVDSSVGGKTGVNFIEGKNLVGAFYQPRAVFIDTKYLETLDDREFRAGFGEVLKCGFVGDGEIVYLLRGKSLDEIRSDDSLLLDLITKSVRFKVDVVVRDEKEEGERRVLNFGHTIGHGIEEATSYEMFLHGEAVAAGMALESQICFLAGACLEEARNLIIGVLEDLGYEILLEEVDYSRVFSLIGRDKKRVARNLWVPVVKDLGSSEIMAFTVQDYEKYAAESLKFIKAFEETKRGKILCHEVMADIQALMVGGRFNDAENLLKKNLDKDPTNETLNMTLARIYMNQKKNSAAIKVLEGILQMNPGNLEALELRKSLEPSLKEIYEKPLDEAETVSPAETIIKLGDEVYRIEGVDDSGELEEMGEEAPVDSMKVSVDEFLEPEDEYDEGLKDGAPPLNTIAMAEVLFREGKSERALEILDSLIERDGDEIRARNLKNRIQSGMARRNKLLGTVGYLEKFLEKIKGGYR